MKTSVFCSISLMISLPTMAQVSQEGTIISPILSTGPAGVVGVPATPQFPALNGAAVSGVDSTGNLNYALSNLFSGPINDQTVTPVLLQLQRSIEQALPVLEALTETAPFQVGNGITGTGGSDTLETGPGIGTRPLAADGNRSGALSPTGVSTAGGLSTQVTPGNVTSVESLSDVNRAALRALMVLQTDLERTLPALAALNGTATNTLASPTVGGTRMGQPGAGVPNTTTTTTIIPRGTSVR